MKTTVEWIDQAKEKHGLSDYALAPLLKITRSQMSRYRNGHDFLSDDAAMELARLLGMEDPRPIIASAHAERAKTAELKSFWEHLAGVAAGVLLAVGLIGSPAPSHASTASITAPLYIMSNHIATQGDRLAGLCAVRTPHCLAPSPAQGHRANRLGPGSTSDAELAALMPCNRHPGVRGWQAANSRRFGQGAVHWGGLARAAVGALAGGPKPCACALPATLFRGDVGARLSVCKLSF